MPADGRFADVLDDLEGLDDKELRDQIERAHLVNQLAEHPGWPLFIDYLTHLTTHLQQRVLSGRCTDIEDYRFLTGRVAGLLNAIQAPKDLLDQVQRLQEQAEQAEAPSDEFI